MPLQRTGSSSGNQVTGSPGWYAIRTSSGYVGLVLHHGQGAFNLGRGFGTVIEAAFVGQPILDLPTLLSNESLKVQRALALLGIDAKQSVTFMTEADTAAGKQQGHPQGGIVGFLTGLVGATPFIKGPQTTQLLFAPGGKPTATSGTQPISTTPSGDVQSVAASASICSPTDIGCWLGKIKIWRIAEFILGILLLAMGLRQLASAANGSQKLVLTPRG